MAYTEWQTQADWETWTWTNADLTSTPGAVKIAAGQESAVGVSRAHQATNWVAWRPITVTGVRPPGCSYYLRFRVAISEGGLSSASWSAYINGVDINGNIVFDRAVWCLNSSAWNVGPWEQIELTIVRD